MLKYVNMNYLRWCNDSVVNKFIKYNQNKNLDRLKENVKKNLNKRDTLFYAIFFKDKHIGHIKCERINFKNPKKVQKCLKKFVRFARDKMIFRVDLKKR